MIRAYMFGAISAFLVFVSRKSLGRPRSHGFFRFFAWYGDGRPGADQAGDDLLMFLDGPHDARSRR